MKFIHVMRELKVFMPQKIWIVFWKIFLFFIFLIEMFKIPLLASFNLEFDHSAVDKIFLFYMPLLTFLLEICLNFNLGYYHNGLIVMNRREIL
jgi:hypothetical protein